MSFWGELKRRKVIRVGAAYLVVAWLLAQIADVFAPALNLPEWSVPFVAFLLVLGFPIAIFLAWAYEITPAGVQRSTDAPISDRSEHLPTIKIHYIATALLVAAVGAFLVLRYESDDSQVTIAVLPFVNLSSDAEQEYFADGLSEEMMSQLAQIDGLLVTARTSSFAFKGRSENVQEIGQRLGVGHVLEGSVRKEGERIRVTAQLIETVDGYEVWSRTYDGGLDQIFDIQESISSEIAGALRVTLGLADDTRLAGGTENSEAYEHYLLGRSYVRRNTPSDTFEAIDEFDRAIALDASFGQARVALGQAYSSVWVIPSPGNITRREQAISDAVAFAADLPGTQLLLAGRHQRAWSWADADEAYVRGLELAPDDFDANFNYGQFLRMTGRVRASLPYLQAARRADPLVLNPEQALSQAYEVLGNYEEAVAHYEKTKTLLGVRPLAEGMHVYRLVGMGANEDAKRHWDSLKSMYDEMGEPTTNLFGTGVGLLDDPPAARDALRRMSEDAPYNCCSMSAHVANWAAHFEDMELAIKAIQRAARANPLSFVYIWLPIWQKIRPQPEFHEFIRESGLPDYWREYGWPEHCRPLGEDDFECV